MKTFSILLVSGMLFTSVNAANVPNRSSGGANATASSLEDTQTFLADQVAEIASSTKLTPQAKQKRIADAVRKAVIVATMNVRDPETAVQIAVELATAASRAAPEYSQTIINSVASVPSIASVAGAVDAVQSGVVGAASTETQDSNGVGNAGPSSPRTPSTPSSGAGGGGVVVASPSR